MRDVENSIFVYLSKENECFIIFRSQIGHQFQSCRVKLLFRWFFAFDKQ